MMKKIWFSLILVVYVNQTVFSCDCIFKSTFCEVTQNFKRTNSIVVKATVLSVSKEVAELQVLSVIVGDESRSTIKCFRHDPLFCGTVPFGNVGETYIYI
jgi:hypothetical protein